MRRLIWRIGALWALGIEEGVPLFAVMRRQEKYQAYDISPVEGHGWRPIGDLCDTLGQAQSAAESYETLGVA